MKKRIFALCSALLLSLTVFAGCGSKPTEESAASEPEATATAAPTAEAESSAAESTAAEPAESSAEVTEAAGDSTADEAYEPVTITLNLERSGLGENVE